MNLKVVFQAAIILLVMGMPSAFAAPRCPINFGSHANIKPNKLYLVFPRSEIIDPKIFPEFGFDPMSTWLPLPRFDSSQLRAFSGTDIELRNKIHSAVTDIFCEFNVQVITTTDPAPPETERRNIIGNFVGIGSDIHPTRPCHQVTFGEANTAGGDPGDSKKVDFARVWAGSYNCPIFSDEHLRGEGWTHAIAGTAAHEAAHNYGLSHEDGLGEAGDLDNRKRHLMRGDGYSEQDRTKPRHFSNFETSVLARLVGLSIDTMWTWEFPNSNPASIAKVRMELLSDTETLILSWVFEGNTSPWINPILSGPSNEIRRFKGKDYKVFSLEWSAANDRWQSGPAGQVPQGKTFQVGATFSSVGKGSPDSVIVSNITLLDQHDQILPRPAWLAFDAGRFDKETGDLNVTFFNVQDRELLLREVVVKDLPRVMSINAMMQDTPISDVFGRPFLAWDKWGIRRPLDESRIQSRDELEVAIANRSQGRHISVQRTNETCTPRGRGLQCHTGITSDDLFPATTVYITGTIVDPAGNESRFHYQIAGRPARVP